MSDDLVNQLTLNFLISKNQLQKLNKKLLEDNDNTRGQNLRLYKARIRELFEKLLNNDETEGLLQEVKMSFDNFLEKCIYYFKSLDNNEHQENERTHVDLEEGLEEEEEGDVEEGEEGEEGEEDLEESSNKHSVFKEEPTKLQKLPLNWFQNVRQDYKKNKIIPRKQELFMPFNHLHSKKNNINNLYDKDK
jgi:hypothetical protein